MKAWFFCLLFILPAQAQETDLYQDVIFRTQPSGARVYLSEENIGQSGKSIRLHRRMFQEHPTSKGLIPRTFRFQLKNHRTYEEKLEWEHFYRPGQSEALVFPPDQAPAFRLAPDNLFVLALDAWPLTSFLALLTTGATFSTYLFLRNRQKQILESQQQTQQEKEVLEVQRKAFEEVRSTTYGPGDILEGYLIKSELGQGASGAVYLAEAQAGQQPSRVAIKVSRKEALSQDEIRRFAREFDIANKIRSPYILSHFSWGSSERGFYFLLELIENGGTLEKFMATKRLSVDDFLDLMEKVAEGVYAAHRAEVFHRDLKPANILITPEGVPKVSDFGIAKDLNRSKITADDAVLGTVAYMAPEQMRSQPTAASDQYALGCIYYEYFSGHIPHQETPEEGAWMILSRRHQGTPPTPIPGLKPKVNAAISKMLAHEPQDRYCDVLTAARELKKEYFSE